MNIYSRPSSAIIVATHVRLFVVFIDKWVEVYGRATIPMVGPAINGQSSEAFHIFNPQVEGTNQGEAQSICPVEDCIHCSNGRVKIVLLLLTSSLV